MSAAGTPLWRSRPGGFEIQPASSERAEPVVEGVFLSPGLSNSYLVVTPEGRVVINTGMGFEAPVHQRNFDAVDDGPVRYIVLTQGHVDHVGGVDWFLRSQPEAARTDVVAQANNASCQADDARIARFRARRSAVFFAEAVARATRLARSQPRDPDAPSPNQATPVPTITFDDRHVFELGGVRFELLATPGGETVDSLCVWLPQRGVAFVGNLFSALFGHVPNLVTIRGDKYRFVPAFLDSLERVRALEPEVLCTGHFEPISGRDRIRAELERIRDGVAAVHDATVAGMNEGKDVHALMREVRLPPALSLGEGYGKVAWNVRAIWESYAGWFHHRSTTELYATPVRSVYPELVELAGGPDALARRAGERLSTGEPLEAIHLCEVALAADPRHPATLRTLLAAHEMLLARSGAGDPAAARRRGNFWEVSWLEHQIEKVRAALAE